MTGHAKHWGQPRRVMRVPDDVWQPAKARAARDGTTVSSVVRAALEAYASGPAGEALVVWPVGDDERVTRKATR